MYTNYGYVKYIYTTWDLITIYVYDITNTVVRAGILDGQPHLSALRVDKEGRQYFLKKRHKVYIDELEVLFVE